MIIADRQRRPQCRGRAPCLLVALAACVAVAIPASAGDTGRFRQAEQPGAERQQRPVGARQREPGETEPQGPALGRRLITLAQVLGVPGAGAGVGRPGTLPELWRPGLAGVRHRDFFPGIDLVYLMENTRVEVALLARPGADLSAIRLGFPDAESLRLEDGDLVLANGVLQTRLRRPTLRTYLEGETREVPGGWLRRGEGEIGVWSGEAIPPAAMVLVHFEASFLEPEVVGPEPAAVDLGGSVPLVDTLVVDNDADGKVDPGDTIRYEATVDNSGDTAAQGTRLDATLDANTALVGGSLNISPLAVDDAYPDAVGGATFTVDAASGVLANDRDPPDPGPCASPGCTITAFDSTSVNGGTVTLNADGSFEYTPPGGFSGDDTFTYTIEDDHPTTPLSDTATVTVTVDAPPVAVDDTATVTEDDPATAIDVLANDTDPDGGTSEITAVTQPADGTVVITGGGSGLTYEPDADFCNDGTPTDDFTYTLGPGGSTATVAVTVTCVDDSPVAVDDAATVNEDSGANTIDVLANDTDPDGGTKVITAITQPASGTVTDNTTDLTYQPNPDFCNDGSPTDDFTYTITGGSTATVAVTVTCVNDPPMAVGETFDVAAGNFDPAIGNTTLQFANADTATEPHVFVAGDVLDNDADPEGGSLGVVAVDGDGGAVGSAKSLPSGAVVTLQANGEFTYSPPVGFEGADSFTYTVSDGTAGATATVSVEIDGMVWYIDNDPAGDGSGDDGRAGSPFDSIAQFEAENGVGGADDPEAGDTIFVFQGTSTYDAGGGDLDGIDLLDGQKLHGEGVGLVVGSTTLVPAGSRPAIDNTNPGGDAVTVLADATEGDRTGVEVRGLQISGDVSGVEVASADAAQVGVTISDNLFAAAGAAAVDVNPGSSGAFVVTVENNAFSTSSPTGNGIDVVTGAGSGDVEVAIDGNTDVTSSTGTGIRLDNSGGGGTLFVTSFSANSVHGNTAGAGIVMSAVTFDADPSDPDFTGDEVAAGNTAVGSSANPVGGPAMVLTNVSGDLAFGQLDLFTDGAGAVGLDVTGAGPFDAGAGTGFELTSTGGTIDSAAGPAVDLDPFTAGLSFDSVSSSSSSTTGVSLDSLEGSFSAAAGSITDPAGTAFDIVGGTVNVTYGGDVTQSNAATAVSVSGGHSGTATFNGQVTAATTTATAVSLAGNTGGTVTFDGGLDIDTTSGTGLSATGGGTVNVTGAGNSVTTATGTAVSVVGATIGGSGVTFDSVSSSGAATGILIDTAGSGSFTASGGTIANATTRGVDVNAGTGNVTYAGTISTTGTTARSVEVTNRTGGVVTLSGAITDTSLGVRVANNAGGATTFSGGSKVVSTGTGTAVTLANNTGHTISFTSGGLDIDTTSGTGFSATGGGVVQVTGSGNTVDTTTGTGIDIADTTIGGSGVVLRSVSSTTASSSTVISLVNTGAGAFEVSGTGTAGSGGTIDNKTADAVQLDNTDGPVTLRHMIIEDIGNMGVVDSEHDAIHGQTVDGGLVLDGMTIRRISDMAVHGAALSDGDADTVWNGLTITGSTFEDTNRYHVAGEGDTSDEGTVRIRGLRGTVLVDGNVFQDGGEHLDLFATAGTLDLTVTANDFFETYKEFSSGSVASVGKMCLDLTVQGAANATVVVGDAADAGKANDFRNCRIASVRIANDAGATGTVTSTVAGNAFLVTDHSSGSGGDFDFPMGGVKYSTRGASTAVFDGRITGNSFTDVTNADGGVGNVTLDMDQGAIQVLVDGNTFHAPGNAAWFVRADATSSFDLEFDTNTYERDAFPCTTDPSCGGGYFGPGLFNRVQVQNGGVIDVTLTNEALAQHDTSFDPGNTVEIQVLNVGGGGTACALFTGNSSPHGYGLEESAGTLSLAQGASAISLPAQCSGGAPGNCVTVLDDNSNTGGGGNAAADPPTVDVFGTIDIQSSACSLPSGGIF